MKKITVLMFLLSIMVFNACKGEKETLNGKWEKKDFSYEFDIQCECTDKQKETIRGLTEESISETANTMTATTHLNFTEDGKVTGNILGEIIDGEYDISGNELSVKTGTTSGNFDIVKDGESTLLKYKLGKDDLESSSSTIDVPNMGKVTLGMTELNLVLSETH